MGFLVLVAVPPGVMAVDFNQTFKFAAVLLKKPCGFNCAAPCGGKGEMLDAVLPHSGDKVCHVLVPYHFADVEVLVAAVAGNLILLEKAALPSSLSSSQTAL